MTDRQPTQLLANGAIRYGVYGSDGQLLRYEYMKREDAPTTEGTPLNKATLLSDTTAAQIWRGTTKPADPTVNDALLKLTEGTARVGDIQITSRADLSAAWLLCDGRTISAAEYPDLFSVLRTNVTPATWDFKLIGSAGSATADGKPVHTISYANGYWFRSAIASSSNYYKNNPIVGKLFYSADLNTWTEINIRTGTGAPRMTELTYLNAGHVHYYENKYVCCVALATGDGNPADCFILTSSNPAGPWTWTHPSVPKSPGNGFTPYSSWADSVYDMLYGKGLYIITSVFGYATATSINGPWTSGYWSSDTSETSPNYFNKLVFNEYDDYWYGYRVYDSVLYRGQSPLNMQSVSGVTTSQGKWIAVNPTGVLVSSSAAGYAFAPTGSSTFTKYTLTGASTNQGYATAIGESWIIYTSTTIYTSNAPAAGFQSVAAQQALTDLASYNNIAVGAVLAEENDLTVSNMQHDFTYDNKKIPAITPDAYSYAYIKAMEE